MYSIRLWLLLIMIIIITEPPSNDDDVCVCDGVRVPWDKSSTRTGPTATRTHNNIIRTTCYVNTIFFFLTWIFLFFWLPARPLQRISRERHYTKTTITTTTICYYFCYILLLLYIYRRRVCRYYRAGTTTILT